MCMFVHIQHAPSMWVDHSSFSSTCSSCCSDTYTIRTLWTNLSNINDIKWKLCVVSHEFILNNIIIIRYYTKLIPKNMIITRVTHIQCSSGVVYSLSPLPSLCTKTLYELSTASVSDTLWLYRLWCTLCWWRLYTDIMYWVDDEADHVETPHCQMMRWTIRQQRITAHDNCPWHYTTTLKMAQTWGYT